VISVAVMFYMLQISICCQQAVSQM